MKEYYRLFISHSWSYPDAYEKMIGLIDNQGIKYYNHSVPKDDPVHTNGTDKQLRQAIYNKMMGCDCILILAGVYATYSKWINIEIELAVEMGKPIIAIQPWGAERTSTIVKNNADKIVGWNGSSVVKAIQELSD